MRSVTGGKTAQSVMKQNSSEFTSKVKWNLISGRNHSSAQQLRKVVVLHIQELCAQPLHRNRVAIKGVTRFSGSRGVKGRYARWDLHLFFEERYFWAHLD
ncbi:hypothetical protein OSB04_006829 [Centaurea solstitialis]|uniref:Uncharacterized protein n=1 Tax=Centaurea solstitialis TaxID=347529 RepID=A0AA38TKG4_9ASTR|nr:hypothetical protein OSB04_006829 [Centaurea solstitialis]